MAEFYFFSEEKLLDFELKKLGNFLYLPVLMKLNFLLTSSDVLHAFSFPELYIKTDIVPGVLHSLFLSLQFSGLYIIYCAQLCGVNHSLMPYYFLVN